MIYKEDTKPKAKFLFPCELSEKQLIWRHTLCIYNEDCGEWTEVESESELKPSIYFYRFTSD